MARASNELVDALRTTARRLAAGAQYQWGHPGACNCGHLAQTVTHLDRGEILAAAAQRHGDWGELAIDACPTTGLPIDWLVERLLALGLTREDIGHLEDLDDRRVLRGVPLQRRRSLRRNRREDVVLYLEIWADQLESELRVDQLAVREGHLAAVARPLGRR